MPSISQVYPLISDPSSITESRLLLYQVFLRGAAGRLIICVFWWHFVYIVTIENV